MIEDFKTYSVIIIALWGLALILLSYDVLKEFFYGKKTKFTGYIYLFLMIAGFGLIIFYTISLWIHLERPPLRTTGETRLWYSIFVVLISLVIYRTWKYKVLLAGGLFFGVLFMVINHANTEALNKTLAPALQSNWFIPHVIVYMLSYSILGMSWFVAVSGLIPKIKTKWHEKEFLIADNLVYIGFGFLTLGLVFGAFWAKEAWGHYWTWDPKETWAMITWLTYLLYIHYRLQHKKDTRKALWILVIAFVLLIICWFGINYMAVGANSIHTYSN